MISNGAVRFALILTTAIFIASAIGVVSPPVAALPQGPIQCQTRTYFSTPAKKIEVGIWDFCPGGTKSGRKTPWVTVESFDIGHPGPRPSLPTGGLPCEFVKGGCANTLPLPHH